MVQVTVDIWHVTCDMWHVTCYMSHITCDRWHVTGEMWPVTCDMWQMICDRWPVTGDRWPCSNGAVWPIVQSSLISHFGTLLCSLWGNIVIQNKIVATQLNFYISYFLRDLNLTTTRQAIIVVSEVWVQKTLCQKATALCFHLHFFLVLKRWRKKNSVHVPIANLRGSNN